jgi:hypothetical protein
VDRGDNDLRDPVLLGAPLHRPVSVLMRLKASNAEVAQAAGMVTSRGRRARQCSTCGMDGGGGEAADDLAGSGICSMARLPTGRR